MMLAFQNAGTFPATIFEKTAAVHGAPGQAISFPVAGAKSTETKNLCSGG
jgi:hypothetical protein